MSETVIYGKNGISSGSVVYGDGGLSSGTFIYDENTFATRNIPTFAGSQYGTIDTPITFTGDFEVEFTFSSSDSAASKAIAGGSSGRPLLRVMSTSGLLRWQFLDSVSATITVDVPSINWADGKVHTGKVSRVGDLFTIECEGNTGSATHVGALSQTWDKIGTYSVSSNPFIGQILSVKFTDKSGAQDVITNYVFDSGSTTEQFARGSTSLKATLINFAITDWFRYTQQRNIAHDAGVIGEAWVGDNLLSDATSRMEAGHDWTVLAGWAISGGVATGNGVSVANMDTTVVMLNGSIHINQFTIANRTTGGVRPSLGGTNGTFNQVNGTFTELIATSDGSGLVRANGLSSTFDGDIDNYSVKHILEVA